MEKGLNVYENQIIQGDCLEVMKGMPDKSIDMVLTSPPYDDLRTYEGYIFDFAGIARELFRITKQGGVVVWVVADATIKGSESGTSFRQALYFKEIGFNLHDTMIWAKDNAVPTQHTRYQSAFEYMFVFSKGKPNTFNKLVVPTKTGGAVHKKHRAVKTGHVYNGEGFYKTKETKLANNWWTISCGSGVVGHGATFPEKLAEDHILSWSREGDTILDPMAGSGTTLKMAKKNGRNYIGIEIAQEYIDIIHKRLDLQKRRT